MRRDSTVVAVVLLVMMWPQLGLAEPREPPDDLRARPDEVAERDADEEFTPECRVDADCPPLAHTARWCSLEGECRYACRPGWGDANQEAVVDGCECELQNGGREVCNGVDDDCDGVVDNPPPHPRSIDCAS